MLSENTGFQAIYIYCGKCDLRKGIDGLATLVKEQFHLDPFQKDVLFLFCGCRTDRFKGLVWEGDGFCLLYKRIEAGRLRWPRSQEEAAGISPEELHLPVGRNDDTGTFLYSGM
ncbi:MAG: IS66 family insertion sequence element accessory protein TnpB [Enterocloster bolteae]